MMPPDATETAQVRFSTQSIHQISFATPLAAFLRVPISWLRSSTHPLFSDETHAMIRRVYTHPTQQFAKRHFCGFCGTSLSHWSEEPLSEADYISLTLGSLLRHDLNDLEDLGLIPDVSGQGSIQKNVESRPGPATFTALAESASPRSRETDSLPWFDTLVDSTPLGRMCRSGGSLKPTDIQGRVEWEIAEWVGVFPDEHRQGPLQVGRSDSSPRVDFVPGTTSLSDAVGGDNWCTRQWKPN